VSRIASYHSNHHEDRRWHFECTQAGFVPNRCEWQSWTEYDDPINVQCSGSNAVLTGFRSVHSNHREDRRWSYLCCSSNDRCMWTGWINYWDAWMDYYVQSGWHIAGIQSYHSNHREDRLWQLRICTDPTTRSAVQGNEGNGTIVDEPALYDCEQTMECLKFGGICRPEGEGWELDEEDEENEYEDRLNGDDKKGKGKKGKGRGRGKGKGKKKGKGMKENKKQNLCKPGCECIKSKSG